MINCKDYNMDSTGTVSKINELLVVQQYLNIPTEGFWERELNIAINWDIVWGYCCVTSQNPANQMIHYKLIIRHILYHSLPTVLYKMKRKSDPFCHLCCSASHTFTYVLGMSSHFNVQILG